MKATQKGFTLIEIAIVLVIIGLLLGGVLKGQELITSARVRNLISQQDGVKAAFFGFQDRFRAFPGDYTQATVNIVGATQNGNGNGRIEAGGNPSEDILAWEHLSRAGFINGSYTYAAAVSPNTNLFNPYSIPVQVVFDNNFADTAGAGIPQRHNIKTGSQIPVDIIAEVDRKIDDGNALRGGFRFTVYDGGTGNAPAAAQCYDTAAGANQGLWRATSGETNCGGASLL